MNRKIFAMCAAALVFMVSCNTDKNLNGKIVRAAYVSTGIKIDGDLSDWEKKDAIYITGEKSASDNTASFMVRWDKNFLYFSYEVTDKDLRSYQTEQDHTALYLDDMAELLIDAENDKDSCWDADDIVYHINLYGQKKDDRGTPDCRSDASWNGVAEIAVKYSGTLNDSTDVDQGYVVEMNIPWTETGQKPVKGLVLGINFAIGDNDGMGRQLFDWAGAMPYRSPYAYGNLILTR